MWHNYKYSLLSIDMKTKVVQHVQRINISISHITCDMWKAKCDMWHVICDIYVTYLQILTFEHRHENKSCSACPKDQHKHFTCNMWHVKGKMWHATCDIITKTHFWAYTWKQNMFSMPPRINISIWHMTCDMCNVTCDIWHAKCDMKHVT